MVKVDGVVHPINVGCVEMVGGMIVVGIGEVGQMELGMYDMMFSSRMSLRSFPSISIKDDAISSTSSTLSTLSALSKSSTVVSVVNGCDGASEVIGITSLEKGMMPVFLKPLMAVVGLKVFQVLAIKVGKSLFVI